jgi:hypothetical protein
VEEGIAASSSSSNEQNRRKSSTSTSGNGGGMGSTQETALPSSQRTSGGGERASSTQNRQQASQRTSGGREGASSTQNRQQAPQRTRGGGESSSTRQESTQPTTFEQATSRPSFEPEIEEASSFEDINSVSRSTSFEPGQNFPLVRALVDAPRPISTADKKETVLRMQEHLKRMTLRDVNVSTCSPPTPSRLKRY